LNRPVDPNFVTGCLQQIRIGPEKRRRGSTEAE